MLKFWNTKLSQVIVHKVGNKTADEGIVLSRKFVDLSSDESISNALINYFLKSFGETEAYSFGHSVDLKMNDVFQIVEQIFKSPKKLLDSSQDLAKILYDVSTHAKIKGGEMYISTFSDIQYKEDFFTAIGIFKSENKELFMQINLDDSSHEIILQNGINLNKLDKGCLILKTNAESGYIIFNIDSNGKGNEALYWKDDFLKLYPLNDDYNNTKNILQLTKQYVTTTLSNEFDINKTDQVDYLNRSVEYFKANDNFDIEHFEKMIFRDSDKIESFRQFGSTFIEKNNIDIADRFEISDIAVKKQARAFKKVLKLDRNFDIYIHGNNDLIEQGVEKDGRKFYKIYYNLES